MQRLRLLTGIYDVPLMFDEVQTGWGATGRMWAHELFDLPVPPDVVVWAKKAQNGVLFVSEELATFFQEEKKFNTTWEGDAVGMVRLLAVLDKIDLDQVRQHMEELPSVVAVHDLHAWTITSGNPVLSAHVIVDDACLAEGRSGEVLDQLGECLGGHFDVKHCTFQIEPVGHLEHETSHHP